MRWYLSAHLAVAAVAASCAVQGPGAGVHSDPPGFLVGGWHGATILFRLVASIFTDTRIYAFPNSGFGYDFGFVAAICAWCIAWALSTGSSRQ